MFVLNKTDKRINIRAEDIEANIKYKIEGRRNGCDFASAADEDRDLMGVGLPRKRRAHLAVL
jgi:hypothetical protein